MVPEPQTVFSRRVLPVFSLLVLVPILIYRWTG
jgi:hypothetical protein